MRHAHQARLVEIGRPKDLHRKVTALPPAGQSPRASLRRKNSPARSPGRPDRGRSLQPGQIVIPRSQRPTDALPGPVRSQHSLNTRIATAYLDGREERFHAQLHGHSDLDLRCSEHVHHSRANSFESDLRLSAIVKWGLLATLV